jgi:hypothetical protein
MRKEIAAAVAAIEETSAEATKDRGKAVCKDMRDPALYTHHYTIPT